MRAALSFINFPFFLTKNLMLGVRVASTTHPKKIIVSRSTCDRRMSVVHDAGGGTRMLVLHDARGVCWWCMMRVC